MFFSILVFIGLTLPINAQIDIKQKMKGAVNPEELVSLSETLPFAQAVEVLNAVSEKITGKRIVSSVDIKEPINIEIDKMPYLKALFVIVQYKNLMIEETPLVIVIKSKTDQKEPLAKEVYAPVTEREVKISALLFEGNVAEMQEKGINWEFLLSRSGLQIGGKLVTVQEQQQTTAQTQAQQKPPEFSIAPKTEFTMGKFEGEATALFRFFETENLGKIIARPTVSVINGIQGRTQVGSDISIKERDFAGNLIDKFYSTGTIIEVTPYIYTEDEIDYIFLKLKIERSSALPGAISTEIRKTAATTSVLLYNGEETAIGGLFVNEETTSRRGIPLLKDLPWWVLGLRYIFGYDEKQITTKEIIMLIKAEILPSLKDRVVKKKEEVLKQEHKNLAEELEKYKKQLKKDEENKKENEKEPK